MRGSRGCRRDSCVSSASEGSAFRATHIESCCGVGAEAWGEVTVTLLMAAFIAVLLLALGVGALTVSPSLCRCGHGAAGHRPVCVARPGGVVCGCSRYERKGLW